MSSYLLLNKPKGVITATRGGAGRRTVLDFIPFSLRPPDEPGQRWYSVSLLDGDSTGLVLLTAAIPFVVTGFLLWTFVG